MVFYWSLRDSKSPQVSRTLLSILADLSNAVVWMVSTLISMSSSPCTNPSVTVPRAPITLSCSIFFKIPQQDRGTYPSFHFLTIILCGQSGQQSAQFYEFSFFVAVDYYKVWSSGRDYVIRLYLTIPEEFVCLIFQNRFWVVHISFVRIDNFQFLATIPSGPPCPPSSV